MHLAGSPDLLLKKKKHYGRGHIPREAVTSGFLVKMTSYVSGDVCPGDQHSVGTSPPYHLGTESAAETQLQGLKKQQGFSLTLNEKLVQTLWNSVWQFLTKLNISLPHDPANIFSVIYPKELKTYVHTKAYTWMFIAALLIVAKTWKSPTCPVVGE